MIALLADDSIDIFGFLLPFWPLHSTAHPILVANFRPIEASMFLLVGSRALSITTIPRTSVAFAVKSVLNVQRHYLIVSVLAFAVT